MHFLLDSSPLGLLSNPSASSEVLEITQWSRDCILAGHRLYIPEIIDYELRRELVRAGKNQGVAKLDALAQVFNYLPLNTSDMIRAAELWALARKQGFQTGDPKKLDIDAILCAQALNLPFPQDQIVVVTSNMRHLSNFVNSENWTNTAPANWTNIAPAN